jgi:chromosomal replication initiator protein
MSFVPTASTVLDPWTRILGALEKKVNRQSFNTWLKPTRMSHLNGRTLFVRIPAPEFQHVGDRYADLIQEAIDKLELEVDEVTFVTPEDDPSTPRLREDGGFPPSSAHGPNAPRMAANTAFRIPAIERIEWRVATFRLAAFRTAAGALRLELRRAAQSAVHL